MDHLIQEQIEFASELSELIKTVCSTRFRSRRVLRHGLSQDQRTMLFRLNFLTQMPQVKLRLRRKERVKIANILRTNYLAGASSHPEFLRGIQFLLVGDAANFNKFVDSYLPEAERGNCEYVSADMQSIHPVLREVRDNFFRDMIRQGVPMGQDVFAYENEVINPLPKLFIEKLGATAIALGFRDQELHDFRVMLEIENGRKYDYTSMMTF